MPGFEQKFKSEFRALNLPAFIVPSDGSVFQMHIILSADGRQKEPRGEGRKRGERADQLSALLWSSATALSEIQVEVHQGWGGCSVGEGLAL